MQRQLRESRGAQRRSNIAAGTVIQLLSADVSQHLPPPGAARASANQGDALGLMPQAWTASIPSASAYPTPSSTARASSAGPC
nr:Uncharacterised protein [Raoultella sp. NCTC 9187]